MSVRSGKNGFSQIMSKNRELFEIGEPFWYSPMSDKTVAVLVEARSAEDDFGEFNSEMCDSHCALSEWCCMKGNVDNEGNNYIPACGTPDREEQVYFKELK